MMITRRLTFMSLVLSLGVTSLALNAGCTRDNPAFNPGPNLPDECREGDEISETFTKFERPDQLDILFVIDNSGSVNSLQSGLARAMPDLLEPLAQEKIHTRVAVVTADATGAVSLGGVGRQGASCAKNTDAIADSKVQKDWQTIAACNVLQGESGDGYMRAFDVLERTIIDKPAALADFRRENARLLIVVVSNEDDCSGAEALGAPTQPVIRNHCLWNIDKLRDVKAFTDELLGEAQTPEGISFAVISGPPTAAKFEQDAKVQPICTGGFGSAFPSNRLYQVAQQFGASGAFFNVCTNTLSQPMRDIARDLALVDSVTFCPAQRLAHEPLYVQTVRDGVPLDLGIGEDGVVFLGRTEECKNGAISISASSLRAIEEVKTSYCALK